MGYKTPTWSPSDYPNQEHINAILERMALETWNLKQRKKMIRKLEKKGLSPQVLGYPKDPYAPSPELLISWRPTGQSRPKKKDKRPTQFPDPNWRPVHGGCVHHSTEDIIEYKCRSKEWKQGKVCAVELKLRSKVVPAEQCHHIYGRYGRLLLWTPGWLPVSAESHLWIHENPEIAATHGWICSEEQWNDESMIPAVGMISACLGSVDAATVAL
jgi:hypothetical protein